MTIRVGIAGATGYTGVELVRLLAQHPEAEVVVAGTESYQGQHLAAVYPHLRERVDLVGREASPEALAGCDVVFTSLPHGLTMALAPAVLAAGGRLIDLGADFRLRDVTAYEQWYRKTHTTPDLMEEAVYGLPELYRERIRGARLVGNPGCYPTACALAAAPLLQAGVVETEGIIFDAKSGVSGAGRGVNLGVHFSEVNENFKAYNIAGTHRHTPEIEQTLSDLAGRPVVVSFTPHLVPMTRGILATGYFTLKAERTTEQLVDLFREFYAGEPFVRVRPAGELPTTKQVWGSNYCDIGLQVDPRTRRVLVISVIDNLVKGAAGQAIQNMNLLFGLPETTGLLNAGPVYP
ncbi:N-acetyl-gamma-glutamyl-phosphate reductase [Symbiobacterium thermophilum]|uniref:N-acetyl-gamma-glutamyl-phosphate reductase n=1 Tax=Symbiobacterium thermophilum TaxID=2734 RepID=A0A953I9V5_SYMTR|nr:N-acetyl-gamma-glutamyl-phosphate reductase [Symbiobacterium thermophilum]MBY6277083.1 N-acetyl-gamma-glutamyl-phosphate reductase [Symbiobacterium thermophilum]